MHKKNSILVTAILLISSLVVFFSSCEKDDNRPDFIVPEATTIELLSGGNQRGFVGEALEKDIEVLVKDLAGNPFEGEMVYFSIKEGSVFAESMATGADGKASVTWILGETAGIQTLTIRGTSTLPGAPIIVLATAEYKNSIWKHKLPAYVIL